MTEAPAWMPPRWRPPTDPVNLAGGSRHYAGCSYAIEAGYRSLELDVRVPASSAPVPVVVWLHGGGYAMGDRRFAPDPVRFSRLFDAVVEHGFALVTVDYRLGREAAFPAAVHDVKAALRWLARFAGDLGIDAARVGMWGESAGGHLASFVTVTQGDPDFEGTLGIRGGAAHIHALVSWYGAMDLTTIVRPSVTPEIEAAFGGNVPDFVKYPPEYFNLGADRYLDARWQRTASPVTHATATTPPTLLIHGEVDGMVPIQQSEVMHARLRELGCDVELIRVPGANHVWQGVEQAIVDDIIDRSLEFFAEHL